MFVLSLLLVSYWGTVDEAAVSELQDQIEEIKADEAADNEA